MADHPKAETGKRTECVKVCMEEDMFLDYSHDAIHADRSVAEYIYLLLRDNKYGHGIQSHRNRKGSEKDSEGQ